LIKRVLFATRRRDVSAGSFPGEWRRAFSVSVDAPTSARPVRVALCTVRPDVTPHPRHDGIGLEWFVDSEHLARYESWLSASGGAGRLERAVDPDRSPVVIADEHVMRGAEWLARRWTQGGVKLKHMAIARRAGGLTLAEFFDLWRSRAGRIGGAVIPDEARGLAYVQNWPQEDAGNWAYDALNEVYFNQTDLAGLQTRIAYFQDTLGDRTEDDLVSESWFVAAEEEVLLESDRS
jgi:hypothetical protein